MSVADDLQDLLEDSQLPIERDIHERVGLWRALREPDIPWLLGWMNLPNQLNGMRWRRSLRWDPDREYVPDPLPGQIADAHADLLFGDEPSITAAKQSDQQRLDDLGNANNLPSELHRAAAIASSESEVWWRVYTDRDASDYPVLQFVSRVDVTPLWRAGRPVAVAFETILEWTDARIVTRHVEIQAPGETRNLLYKGAPDRLGTRLGLDSHIDTAGLPDAWRHAGLMLAGRILNRPSTTSTSRLGKSDFQGLEPLMLKLNEATTVGGENMTLTAKKRLFVASRFLDSQGNMPAGDDVFVGDADGAELGSSPNAPIHEAEYSFDAAAMIAYTSNIIERIVTRAGLVAQWVGEGEQGRAESGTALRVRLLPATLTAHGKSRFWTDELPRILGAMQLVDAMSEQDGGFGRQWSSAADLPQVALGDPIPPDAVEDAQRSAVLVTAGLQSRETTIRELHTDWSDEEVAAELLRIASDQTAAASLLPDPFASTTDGQPADTTGVPV